MVYKNILRVLCCRGENAFEDLEYKNAELEYELKWVRVKNKLTQVPIKNFEWPNVCPKDLSFEVPTQLCAIQVLDSIMYVRVNIVN